MRLRSVALVIATQVAIIALAGATYLYGEANGYRQAKMELPSDCIVEGVREPAGARMTSINDRLSEGYAIVDNVPSGPPTHGYRLLTLCR